jgi:hypothetical protein
MTVADQYDVFQFDESLFDPTVDALLKADRYSVYLLY